MIPEASDEITYVTTLERVVNIMNRKVRVMTAVYKNIHLPASEARWVRGFFADLDQSDSNLHNHKENGDQIYQYPVVQYKVLNNSPFIVALEDGIRSIHPHLMEQTELRLGENTYTDLALDIKLQELPLGDSRIVRQYAFITPWLALNQENYEKYTRSSDEEKEQMLSQILVGNILSMCKRFGVTIENHLTATHQLQETQVLYKGRKMNGFTGTFQMNCCIPDLCGIGKGTARGFGTVKIQKERKGQEDGE